MLGTEPVLLSSIELLMTKPEAGRGFLCSSSTPLGVGGGNN